MLLSIGIASDNDSQTHAYIVHTQRCKHKNVFQAVCQNMQSVYACTAEPPLSAFCEIY